MNTVLLDPVMAENDQGTDAIAIDPVIQHAMAFTEMYKRYGKGQQSVREAMCLATQYPAMLGKLRNDDHFAGRNGPRLISYFTHQVSTTTQDRQRGGKQGGYCFEFDAPFDEKRTAAERDILRELAAFWRHECINAKYREAWDEEMHTYIQADVRWEYGGNTVKGRGKISGGGLSGCSMILDYSKLLSGGLPGLYERVLTRRARAQEKGEDLDLFDGSLLALDIVRDVCLEYACQAGELARNTDGAAAEGMRELQKMLISITERAPETLREALQLCWIYAIVNFDFPEFARFDDVFARFYRHDIDTGMLSKSSAEDLLLAFWNKMEEQGSRFADRVVVGGLGRTNERDADELALAVLRTIPRHRKLSPQFTFRYHRDQDSRLFDTALAALADEATMPLIYNDDVVVPGVAKHFDVPLTTAMRYHPHGCGEFTLAGMSPTPITAGFNVVKALEAALHNGKNILGDPIGLRTGHPADFNSFEELYAAFEKQLSFGARLGAKNFAAQYKTHRDECSFLLAGLLMDDCLERGRSTLDGGLRYMGACLVGHGYANTADSLAAIRKIVFEQKRYTLEEIVDALDRDFAGKETMRKELLALPKFGNDDDDADTMFARVWTSIHQASRKAGKDAGLHYLVVSSVNDGAYYMGFDTGATPDGRKCGEPFAVGTVPSAGMDRNGLTALLNSLSKVPAENGGSTSNMKFSRTVLTAERTKFKAALTVYFSRGGQQASITAVNVDDLENALTHPEQYGNLLVRVGGYCARFVELSPEMQRDIIRRTLYS
ncbi:MAG: pyruvate formate lyase family protein [Spirochaetota bacterium]